MFSTAPVSCRYVTRGNCGKDFLSPGGSLSLIGGDIDRYRQLVMVMVSGIACDCPPPDALMVMDCAPAGGTLDEFLALLHPAIAPARVSAIATIPRQCRRRL